MTAYIEKTNKLIKAASSLGSGTVLKAIGKLVPGIGQFVSGAYTAGYAADQVLDFVKNQLESPAQKRNRQQLESRSEQGVARSDENAALSQMEQHQAPVNALAGIGRLGSQAAGAIASSRAGAEQQANERQVQQQQLQQQEAVQLLKQQSEEARQQEFAQNYQLKQRELSQRNLNAQAALAKKEEEAAKSREEKERKRQEDIEFRKRSEERAIEKHKASMEKPLIKSSLNKKIPQTHGDVLKELYDLANRAP